MADGVKLDFIFPENAPGRGRCVSDGTGFFFGEMAPRKDANPNTA
jgi:hypothetical protein